MTSIASTIAAAGRQGPNRPFGAAQMQQPAQSERLHTFLDAAAGEGLVLGGVDAADLYIELFPELYAAGTRAGPWR